MLEGKVALVTGSAGSVGGGIARLFADHGAAVAVHGRDAPALAAVREQIEWIGARAMQVDAELTRYDDVEAMCQRVEDELGPIDVLVAGAGVSSTRPGLSMDDAWWEPRDAELTATFYTIKAVLRRMRARRSGAIVVVSSAAPRSSAGMFSAPDARANVGIQGLTRDIALQAAPYDVRVNCIVPRVTLADHRDEVVRASWATPAAAESPRRHTLADDVADAALYLASDASAWTWLTGAVVDVPPIRPASLRPTRLASAPRSLPESVRSPHARAAPRPTRRS